MLRCPGDSACWRPSSQQQGKSVPDILTCTLLASHPSVCKTNNEAGPSKGDSMRLWSKMPINIWTLRLLPWLSCKINPPKPTYLLKNPDHIYSLCMHNLSFVVTGKLQAVKTSAPLEAPRFLWRGCFPRRKSWEDDLFRALNTRLDKCNDIQMSAVILCLWGASSNWILIKYWERERNVVFNNESSPPTSLLWRACSLLYRMGSASRERPGRVCIHCAWGHV